MVSVPIQIVVRYQKVYLDLQKAWLEKEISHVISTMSSLVVTHFDICTTQVLPSFRPIVDLKYTAVKEMLGRYQTY